MDAAEIVEAERHKLRMGRLLADATIAELEAERDRLRAALTEIDAHGGGSWIGEIARAALAGEEKPDGGLIPQPTRREMGVDAPDFGPLLGEGKP
jgi:hypothetical protein